jgi:hypothetical protein
MYYPNAVEIVTDKVGEYIPVAPATTFVLA